MMSTYVHYQQDYLLIHASNRIKESCHPSLHHCQLRPLHDMPPVSLLTNAHSDKHF